MVTTRVGFAGGRTDDPTYHKVCTKTTGHAEVVEVVYNPAALSTRAFLTEFFTLHDPTIDRTAKGGQYRSAIFYRQDDQRIAAAIRTAYQMIGELETEGYDIATQIRPIPRFYPAENRHQQYCATRGLTPKKRGSDRIREILTL